MEGDENQVYVGTHTADKEAQSVFHYDPNQQTASTILSCINPTYILCHGDFVYLVSEVEKGEIVTLCGPKNEMVSRVSTMGSQPCHLSTNLSGTYLTVCNYGSGSVAIFILENGKPTKIRCFMTHEGSSTNPERQAGPHPHCSVFTQCESILFVTDLGTDVVYYYSITGESIGAQKQKSIKMPGSGPRTICLPNEKTDKRAFVSCQLDNTLRILGYENGPLELLVAFRLSNNADNFPSEVKFWRNQLYVALRGDNMMIVFDDDEQKKEKLKQKLAFKVGECPRHFTITDYGVMYVSCQKADVVQRYLFKDEKILQIGELNIPNATCVAISSMTSSVKQEGQK